MAFLTFALWDILWESLKYHIFPGRILIKQSELGRTYPSPTTREGLCEAEEDLRAVREISGKCVNKILVSLNASRSRVKLLKVPFHFTLCGESPPFVCLECDNFCIQWFAEFLLRERKGNHSKFLFPRPPMTWQDYDTPTDTDLCMSTARFGYRGPNSFHWNLVTQQV